MDKILEVIEAQHWDYEEGWIPTNIEFVRNNCVTMIKNPDSKSIQTNRVVRASFSAENADERIEEILDFYREVPFSWWVGPRDRPDDLLHRLRQKRFQVIDEYIGMAFDLRNYVSFKGQNVYDFREVSCDAELQTEVDVTAKIWGYDDETAGVVFSERKAYLDLPSRRGGFNVVLDGNKGIAYANYRYSGDGKSLYLNGAGVLSEYRHRGVYTQLVLDRLAAAKERGCMWVTTQARKGMSQPILRKLGFQEYGTYAQMAQNP